MGYLCLAFCILALLPVLQAQNPQQESNSGSFITSILKRVKVREIAERLKRIGEEIRNKAVAVSGLLKRKVKEAMGICAYNLEQQFIRLVDELKEMLKFKTKDGNERTWEVESLQLIDIRGMFEQLKHKLQTLTEKDLDVIIEHTVKTFEYGLGVRNILIDVLKQEGLVCFKWLVKKTAREISQGNFLNPNDLQE